MDTRTPQIGDLVVYQYRIKTGNAIGLVMNIRREMNNFSRMSDIIQVCWIPKISFVESDFEYRIPQLAVLR